MTDIDERLKTIVTELTAQNAGNLNSEDLISTLHQVRSDLENGITPAPQATLDTVRQMRTGRELGQRHNAKRGAK